MHQGAARAYCLCSWSHWSDLLIPLKQVATPKCIKWNEQINLGTFNEAIYERIYKCYVCRNPPSDTTFQNLINKWMVGKDRARGRWAGMMLMTKSTCKKQPCSDWSPSHQLSVMYGSQEELGEVVEGLASWRLAASLVWTGRDWFVTRGPFDWAKSPDLNLSLPPYLCCPFFLPYILVLAQQQGKGTQVVADTEQKGWGSPLLKPYNDRQGRSSSSHVSLSISPLEL